TGGVTPAGGDGNAHGSLTTYQLLDGLQDFSWLGVPPRSLLGEYRPAVNRHLEHPTGGFDQFHFSVGKGLLQLSRQTGGSGFVVSNHTVLNGD
ncbi:MAG: hypothetical protein M3Q75_07285, partial [Gemmatimonadota bacterium]|nr:hypothetical protein [Gemmatimonadota bacterium]